MEHDFGVVRPGQISSHTFLFVNPTNTPLQSARIRRSCSCTVAKVTPAIIEPGAEARIEVAYEVPRKAATDSKSMGIQFKEVPSLWVTLRVTATIRPTLYFREEQIAFTGMPKNARQSQPVRTQNFGDELWSSITVHDSPDWLSWRAERVESKPPAKPDSHIGPLEEWSVIFTVDESRLAGDEAEVKLVIEAATVDSNPATANAQGELTVQAAAERKLQAFPSRLHVRTTAGEVVRKNVILKLGPDCQDASAGEFHVTHDLGEHIAVGEITGSGEVRRVTVSFQHRSGTATGSIAIGLTPAGSDEPVAGAVVPIVFNE